MLNRALNDDSNANCLTQRRLIPVIDWFGRHIGDVDPDDVDAVLKSGEYEIHIGFDRLAYLNPMRRPDD